MRIISAYCAVLLIWSTTPLGIKWSNGSMSFASAITLRMVMALVCCAVIMRVLKKPLITHPRDWLIFLAGALGLFPNMLIVYWSAQFISSGLISVLLGFFPLFAGLFTWVLLRENIFNFTKILALVLALIGLWFIHHEQLAITLNAVWGVVGVLGAAAMWAMSSVWVKFLGVKLDPLRQSTGTLVIAAPCFVLFWLLFDRQIPQAITVQSWCGVIYLVIAGSLVGYTLYFYVLRECSMSAAAALTLMSPILAIIIGYFVLHEKLRWGEVLGAGLIVLSLGFYLGVFSWLITRLRKSRIRVFLPQQENAGL